MPARIGLEHKLDWDTRQPLQHGMIQVTLPVLEQQDFDRTPHRNPTENQQALLEALNECPLDVAQQAAQPETPGEYAQGGDECEASNPHAASKVSLTLLVRSAKVYVNGIGRVGRVRAQRLGKVNEQTQGLCRPVSPRAGEDVALGATVQRSLLKWRGIQRVEQLRQTAYADFDRGHGFALDMMVTQSECVSGTAGRTALREAGTIASGGSAPRGLYYRRGSKRRRGKWRAGRPVTKWYQRTSEQPVRRKLKMHGYVTNIERDTLANDDYRRVLYTGPNTQLVLMTLQPGDEIGEETHEEHDQFIRVEAGAGVVLLNGERHTLSDGSAVVIPAGVRHNVFNMSVDAPLRLYTLYSPPEHPDGTLQHTKADEAAAKSGGR